MAVYQVESGICHGRGFSGSDPNGILAKFYTWVTKAPGAGGPQWYIIDNKSALGTDPYIIICNLASPTVNQIAKILKVGMVTTEAGYIRVQYYMWWNVGTSTGYGLWGGHRISTYDDADFSYDFRGGDECMIIQSRLGIDWYTSGLDEWEGLTNLVEGTDKTGILQAGITAGTNVIVQLGSGQAANFTLNKYYYIYDFQSHAWVNYTYVTNVDLINDRITLYNLAQNFPLGAVVCAYAHRFMNFGGGVSNAINDIQYTGKLSKFPYCSSPEQANVFHDQVGPIYAASYISVHDQLISIVSPDDEGLYAAQRPVVVEFHKENVTASQTVGMNRGYGLLKNVFVSANSSMAKGMDGKTISGVNYLYTQRVSDVTSNTSGGTLQAFMFRDTESLI